MLKTLSQFFSRVSKKAHNVLLPGLPFSFKVILNAKEFARVMTMHRIKTRAEDVTLKLGKIDTILGQYHMDDGTIEVDVLEIAMARVQNPSSEDLDREITRTLAHELRHSWQHQKYGQFKMNLDKLVMYYGILIPIWIFLIYPFLGRMVNLVLTGSPLSILIAGLGIYCAFKLYKFVALIVRVMAYRFCWIERDARKFAEQAINDPNWADVIKVERGLVLPSHILVPEGLELIFPTVDREYSTV